MKNILTRKTQVVTVFLVILTVIKMLHGKRKMYGLHRSSLGCGVVDKQADHQVSRRRFAKLALRYTRHGCFKSHIAAIKRFFIFVRRSGTSLASKCKHGSSLDISFLSVTHIL